MAEKIYAQWQCHLCNWFGHNGWAEAEAKYALSELAKCIIADSTIADTLKHGREGHKNGDRESIQRIIRDVDVGLKDDQKANLNKLRRQAL